MKKAVTGMLKIFKERCYSVSEANVEARLIPSAGQLLQTLFISAPSGKTSMVKGR